MGGIPFSAGQQMLYDAQQRFVRAGLPVFLRVKNYPENVQGDYLEVGVPWVPTGTAAADTSFIDIPIDPPPNVAEATKKNVSPLVWTRLNVGARIFKISNTFVQAQLALLAKSNPPVTNPNAVFRGRDGRPCIGIFYDNKLYAIESLAHDQVSATAIEWRLYCNAVDVQDDGTPG